MLADLERAQGLRQSGGGGRRLSQSGRSCSGLLGSGRTNGGSSRTSTGGAGNGGASECVIWCS